jgi:DNA-binding transcriptional ArsR family regulator
MNDPAPLTPLAERLSALAHPARLEILRSLAELDCCCCKDVVGRLDLAQSTVSQHLKVLVDAGLVRFTPNGARSLYRLDRAALAGLSASVTELVANCCAPPSGAPGNE